MNGVLHRLRRAALLSTGEDLGDSRLLEAFLRRRDEAAFEILMRRHGPVVLGVCRRVLGNADDAEDAFQATFLVLAQKAASVRSREVLASWLYGVAYRTAMKARAMSARRRVVERRAAQAMPRPAAPDEGSEELLARLDAELSRLPERYRAPVVLCELQGRSRRDAARTLGIPEGTLSWRLARARKLLARALSRPGMPLSAGAVAAAWAEGTACGSVSASLVCSTARAAVQLVARRALVAGAVSTQVQTLTEGVIKAMLLSKLKAVWTFALVASLGVGGVGLTYRAVAAEPAQTGDAPTAERSMRTELEQMRLEIEALRKGLQATRERLQTLEKEVQDEKQSAAAKRSAPERINDQRDREATAALLGKALRDREKQGQAMQIIYSHLQVAPKAPEARDPAAIAEETLKKLIRCYSCHSGRSARVDNQEAFHELERILKAIRERPKQPAADGRPSR